MSEIWREVKYANVAPIYMVSNLSRVKSIARQTKIKGGILSSRKERILSQRRVLNGYLMTNLKYADDYTKGMSVFVHRLVATAFIPNPEKKPEVNHLNGNKEHNTIENLEWCTSSENAIHAFKTGLRINLPGVDHPRSIVTEDQVRYIRNTYQPRKYSMRRLGKEFGVSCYCIFSIIKRKTWNHV